MLPNIYILLARYTVKEGNACSLGSFHGGRHRRAMPSHWQSGLVKRNTLIDSQALFAHRELSRKTLSSLPPPGRVRSGPRNKSRPMDLMILRQHACAPKRSLRAWWLCSSRPSPTEAPLPVALRPASAVLAEGLAETSSRVVLRAEKCFTWSWCEGGVCHMLMVCEVDSV